MKQAAAMNQNNAAQHNAKPPRRAFWSIRTKLAVYFSLAAVAHSGTTNGHEFLALGGQFGEAYDSRGKKKGWNRLKPNLDVWTLLFLVPLVPLLVRTFL